MKVLFSIILFSALLSHTKLAHSGDPFGGGFGVRPIGSLSVGSPVPVLTVQSFPYEQVEALIIKNGSLLEVSDIPDFFNLEVHGVEKVYRDGRVYLSIDPRVVREILMTNGHYSSVGNVTLI